MAKYLEIVKLLENRIRHGDYLLKEIPAERELASEVGVSQITARKAYLELVNKGTLVRKPNGRLQINRGNEGGGPSSCSWRFYPRIFRHPTWKTGEPRLPRLWTAFMRCCGRCCSFTGMIR